MSALARYGQRNIVTCKKNLRSKRHVFRVPACKSQTPHVVGEGTNTLCVARCLYHSLISSTSLPCRARPTECPRQGRWFTDWVLGFVLKFFSNSKFYKIFKVKDLREHLVLVFGSQMEIPGCWEVQFSSKVIKRYKWKGGRDENWCAFFCFIIWADHWVVTRELEWNSTSPSNHVH